jgi:hypothetical protein
VNQRANAGHCFRPNGDLQVAWTLSDYPGLILFTVTGFRGGVKARVDSWCEPRCPSCGRSTERCHHPSCVPGKEPPP